MGSMSYISSMGLCGLSRLGGFYACYGFNYSVSFMGSEGSLVSMGS